RPPRRAAHRCHAASRPAHRGRRSGGGRAGWAPARGRGRGRTRRPAPPATTPAGASAKSAGTRRAAESARSERPSIALWYNRRVRSPAVPVLDRYIIRELISPFLFGGALFTLFLVIDRLY